MKISYNWLKQFIEFNINPDDLSKILTNLGLEVEAIEKFESIKGGLKGVIAGHVIECEKHPNADRLKMTKVKMDENTILQIICGASNVSSGQNVAVATVGAILYDQSEKPFKINKSKIRGELSMGMICSEKELGISDNHEGILVLDKSTKIGTPIKNIIDIENDYIFEISLTPNRSDAISHMGVARDLKAAFDINKIDYKSIIINTDLFKVENNSNPIPVEVLNSKKCFHYHGLTISNIKVDDSPGWLKNKLNSIGITPKNNIIDITNYILHHLGQPLHAFNSDVINNKIVVKECIKNTKFTTLDEVERLLDKDDLMICDSKKPLCIAGVFGGLNSGIDQNTTNIFLESAYFESTTIRKTAKRHGLSTDASYRFERGVDPDIGLFSLKLAASLIKSITGGVISSEIQSFSKPLKKRKNINLKFDKLNSLIGEILPKKTILSILKSLEIKIIKQSKTEILLEVPRYRTDVTRPADVIEEILRVYGYNNLKSSDLKYKFKPTFNWSEPSKIEKSIAKHLTSNGFNEILNNSLTSLNYKTDNFHKPVEIFNPLSKELSKLRQSLIHSTLETISYNINRQNTNLKLFEFGKIYGKENEKFQESLRLCISICGNIFKENWNVNFSVSEFYYLKGLVSDMLEILKIKGFKGNYFNNSFFSEGIQYKLKEILLVDIGLVNNDVLEKFNITSPIYLAEFYWDNILKFAYKETTVFKKIPKYPSSKRDFALLVDESISFDSIKKIAFKTENKILNSVNLFDYYKGKELPVEKKSYGVSFDFQNISKTLTDKEIDGVMNKLKLNFNKELGAELR